MANANRPQGRQKTVGTGSAKVTAGKKVDTGSRPVGSGSRPGSSGASHGGSGGRRSSGSGSSGSGRASFGGIKLNFKTILIIVAVILVLGFVVKKMGGTGNNVPLVDSIVNSGDSSLSDSSASGNYSGPASYSAADTTVSKDARAKYVSLNGNGSDKVTIMVYMCGTDLESKYGMATSDLVEMQKADIASNVNLIVETGGCKKWKNNVVSADHNQIFKIENHGLTKIENNMGSASMTDPDNLTDFIKYCAKKYPANRNILIFWDHGGGSLSGYGYDEKNPSSSSMTLAKINGALNKAGVKFDFIGFDACLMATLETALVCDNYADYMIASEESEPGTGWYYTNWLTAISENTSLSTVDVSKIIIDDFVAASTQSQRNAKVTLSVLDLSELHSTVPSALSSFAESANEMLKTDDYKKISEARAGVRQFSEQNKLNQVDLIDLAQRIGTPEASALANALKGAVKYNKTTISRSNGVSIYFPYETTKSVKSALASYSELGLSDEYARCIKSFASLETAGQITAAASQQSSPISGDLIGSLLGGLMGGGSSSGSSSPIGSILTGLAGSSSSASPLGSLFTSLVGGSASSGSSSGSLIGSLLGGLMGGGSSSSQSGGINAASVIQLLSAFSGRSMPAEYDWLDTELVAANAENIAENYIDPSRIVASEKNGVNVLALTDEEWALIPTVELNVFVESGDGYVDLGLDNVFDWTDDGDLLLTYDNTWLTLNDNVCAFYFVSDTYTDDGGHVTTGRIPAMLNDSFVNLNVVFDYANPQGIVTGAYPLYDDVDVQAKGDIAITAGDEIRLLCDYYTKDGESCACTLGDAFTVPESGLSLINLALENDSITAAYRLTDIYGNFYWINIE